MLKLVYDLLASKCTLAQAGVHYRCNRIAYIISMTIISAGRIQNWSEGGFQKS